MPRRPASTRDEQRELAPYLDAMRAYPPLGRAEEHALALRARRGDLDARHTLVRHSLAFVVSMARAQQRGTLPLADIVQEGNLGLIRATETFDPSAGTRFLTYAGWWIRAYIGKHMHQARSVIRPRSGVVAQHDLSLDAPVGAGEDSELTRLELLEDHAPSPEEASADSSCDRKVRAILLSVRKRVGEIGWDVIHNRLQHPSPSTLQEIGDRWGVSRERVRQIEVRTKELLQQRLAALQTERDAA